MSLSLLVTEIWIFLWFFENFLNLCFQGRGGIHRNGWILMKFCKKCFFVRENKMACRRNWSFELLKIMGRLMHPTQRHLWIKSNVNAFEVAGKSQNCENIIYFHGQSQLICCYNPNINLQKVIWPCINVKTNETKSVEFWGVLMMKSWQMVSRMKFPKLNNL